MNNQDSFYQYIVDWLDKLNINLEVSQSELRNKIAVIADKAIKYEVVTSILWIAILSALLAAIWVIIKKTLKANNVATIRESFKYLSNSKECENTKEYNSNLLVAVVGAISILLILFIAPSIVGQIIDIIECIVFPEKILLEFIGRYI